MKAIFSTLLATAAAASMAQAFTIDFNSLLAPDGSDLTGASVSSGSPLVITVPGYGTVRFEVGGTDVLNVDQNHSNDGGTTFQNSLELDAGERVLVTFVGPEAMNVNFDIIGLNSGEAANPVAVGITGDEYQLDAIGGDGVGIAAISWDAVPEPSSSLLILLGAGSLVLRRSRG